MLIDTHAHLTDSSYQNVDQIIENFEKDNLKMVFTVGFDLKSSISCVDLAHKHQNVYAIIGFHPTDIDGLNDATLAQIKQLAQNKKVVAIGEIGLDYHYGKENETAQKEGLVKQLILAHDLGLPVVFHVRDAYSDIIEFLKPYKHLLTNGGVFHCFGEDIATYNTLYKEFGFMVSIGGAVTFKNATTLQNTVKDIPLTNLLLETDCPYLTPVPYRGKEINQPKYVSLVAAKIAELKGIAVKAVEQTTTENAYKLFKKIS